MNGQKCEGHAAQFRAYRLTGDRAMRNELVQYYRWLAAAIAGRFARRGELLEDLEQVAMLALVKAVERYDPDYGSSFPAFASTTITGEIRRHFRDATWPVHVTRRRQEMYLAVASARHTLTQKLGRSPGVDDVATALNFTTDDVIEALEVGTAYRPTPLACTPDDETTIERAAAIASDDVLLASADTRVILRQLIADLPGRERRIIFLRFFSELTQAEIAERVGVSQVHVSRLLKVTMRMLRSRLEQRAASDT